MFIYSTNKPNSSPSLSSFSKRAKLKHNNVFVNKLVNNGARFKIYIYIYIILYIYRYTNIFKNELNIDLILDYVRL